MPIYEYECRKCGEDFSLLRRLSDKDEEIECPSCGTRHPKRLYSTFAAGKGNGKAAASAAGCGAPGCGTSAFR